MAATLDRDEGNWLADAHLVARLTLRESVLSDGWCVVLEDDPRGGSLAEACHRAATLTVAAIHFHDAIVTGSLPIDREGDLALDMSQYRSLFGVALLPRPGRDDLVRGRGEDILVLVGGKTYAVPVLPHPVGTWRAIFERIVQDANERQDGSPALATAAPRDDWFRLYDAIAGDDEAALDAAHGALFTVCLDVDADAKTDEAFARQAYAHGYANRWYDHPVQVVVAKNGTAAIVGCFRAGIEGRVAAVLCSEVQRRAAALDPSEGAGEAGPWRRIEWTMDASTERELAAMRRAIDVRLTSDRARWVVEGLGRRAFARMKLRPDAAFHLLLRGALKEVLTQRFDVRAMIDARRFEGGRVRTFEPPTDAIDRLLAAGRLDPDLVAEVDRVHRAAIDAEKELGPASSLPVELVSFLAPRVEGWPGRILTALLGARWSTADTIHVIVSNVRRPPGCAFHGPLGYVSTSRTLGVNVLVDEDALDLTFQVGRDTEDLPEKISAAIEALGSRLASST